MMKEIIKYQNMSSTFRYTKSQLDYIKALGLLTGSEWDVENSNMLSIKESIKQQLEQIQEGYCIYCGRHKNLLGEHLERDHIAPKNSRKYPNFMFEPFNIVLACHGYNGSSKKGQMDTISEYSDNYHDCKFNIIHPYFDDFYDHITYAKEKESIILKYKTDKGKKTITTFDLNNIMLAYMRGKDINIGKYELSEYGNNIVDGIMSRQYTT